MPIVILSCYVLCPMCFMYWNMYIRTPGKTTTYEGNISNYAILATSRYCTCVEFMTSLLRHV